MAQYKRSRLANMSLTGTDAHGRTFGGTMLTFIFALLLMILIGLFLSIGVTFTKNSTPVQVNDDGLLVLSDDLAIDGPYSSHISDGWIFVPNISPEEVESLLNQAVEEESASDDNEIEHYWASSQLTRDKIHTSNVTIRDTWRGWFDYDYPDDQVNTLNEDGYQKYFIENSYLYSSAYIGHFKCNEDIESLSLTFHKYNGTAWIFCNGKFIDRIGDKTPGFNFHAFADYCTVIPDDSYIDLVIVIACPTQVANPGLLSEPIIETETSNSIRTIITAGHFAIVTLLFFVTIAIGSNIILGATKNKWLFISFFASFVSMLLFYLTDCRFISVDSHVRADARFVLLILASVSSFIENSQFFAKTKTSQKNALLRKGHYYVIAFGLMFIVSYFLFEYVLGTLLPVFVAIMFAMSVTIFSIFIDLFFYNREDQRTLLWALLFSMMFLILDLAILIDGMFTYLVPTYSNIFVIFTCVAATSLVTTFISQQRELKRSAAVLKRQVREKTIYISEINRDLVITNKKLMEGEIARKNVLSNVSHDLRTPITAIRGYAELMLSAQDTLSLEQRNSYLSNIVRRSEQMERIVSDIMELTRMESSDSDFRFTSVSISEMLDELVVMFSMDLEDTGKHLSLDLPPRDSLIVKADPAKLSRVFENLISNAINYTEETADIKVTAWRTGDEEHIEDQKVHISVEDNGIGIPEQEIPRIFDRFYRAHNSGINIKGTGLGLAIVKLICDKHDAEIKVTSTLGQGTTFEVILAASF